MKFTLELPIERSRAEVWKAFDNPEKKSASVNSHR